MLRCLNGLIDVSKLAIDRVAYEEVTFESGSVYASHKWGGAEAMLEMWLESRGFRENQVVKIHVAAVKALAVGKGGGKGTQKESILAAARRRHEWAGIEFPDDNAADAAYVGLAALFGVTKPAAKKKTRSRPKLAGSRSPQKSLPLS